MEFFYDEQYPSQGVVWQRWLIELNKPRDWGWGTEAQDDLKVKVQNVLKEPNTGDADKEKIKEALQLLDDALQKTSNEIVSGVLTHIEVINKLCDKLEEIKKVLTS